MTESNTSQHTATHSSAQAAAPGGGNGRETEMHKERERASACKFGMELSSAINWSEGGGRGPISRRRISIALREDSSSFRT